MRCLTSPGIKVPVMLECNGRETHSAEWCLPLSIDGYMKHWRNTRWVSMKGEKGLNGITSYELFEKKYFSA